MSCRALIAPCAKLSGSHTEDMECLSGNGFDVMALNKLVLDSSPNFSTCQAKMRHGMGGLQRADCTLCHSLLYIDRIPTLLATVINRYGIYQMCY
jgi:hypothetical protein